MGHQQCMLLCTTRQCKIRIDWNFGFEILSWISTYWWHWKMMIKSGNRPLKGHYSVQTWSWVIENQVRVQSSGSRSLESSHRAHWVQVESFKLSVKLRLVRPFYRVESDIFCQVTSGCEQRNAVHVLCYRGTWPKLYKMCLPDSHFCNPHSLYHFLAKT